ncbi:His Kinase A (phospho-acceptor) domain-containing protein [Ekhidna lutea]|uniref:histidine kinase n=1 Tax=Ekhidna lutea TaxID=447679 RepID=A0A239K791_EKHLU|nr:HAMP domain-containing sensor histidine kinase [Ekhidna lutea]SNT13552.1 His Kinase A (phospho-acceptor) domain-containing protein [Ekhidna lutea]
MRILKEEDIEEKLRLFESSVSHMWIDWSNPEIFQVIDFKGIKVLEIGEYHLTKIVEEKEINSLRTFWNKLSDELCECLFTIHSQGKKFIINCSGQKIGDEVKCLCVVIPEKDNTILYLQNAAHDFRAPLGSIIGLVNLLQHSLTSAEEVDKEELLTYLDMIKMNGNKSLNLANEVLALAEIESETYQLKVVPVPMIEFMRRYLDTHRLLTMKKQIKVHLTCESESSVYINEAKFTRVMDNILGNSVKFSESGSNINISIEDVADNVYINIADEGIGMSNDILKNVFVKFGKSKRPGLGGEPSHGLGMSIVRQIMHLHEGDVNVSSTEGVGTKVTLILKKAP